MNTLEYFVRVGYTARSSGASHLRWREYVAGVACPSFVGARADIDVDVTGAEPPEGVAVEDLGDVTLLPGLIDTHTHLVFDASDAVVANVQAATAEELLTYMRSVALSVLEAGITTVRDLGDRDYLSLMIREETAACPTLVPASSRPGRR